MIEVVFGQTVSPPCKRWHCLPPLSKASPADPATEKPGPLASDKVRSWDQILLRLPARKEGSSRLDSPH